MKNRDAPNLRMLWIIVPVSFCGGFLLRSLLLLHEPILTSKLLDWPFLAFLLIACCIMAFFRPLVALLARGELTIAWGKDQSVKISNLSNAVSAELAPLQEDIEELKSNFGRLQTSHVGLADISAERAEPNAERENGANARDAQKRLLREALDNPKYKWRTIERLAAIVHASEDDVCGLLLTMDDVRLSRSMTGHPIAGLRSRVGPP